MVTVNEKTLRRFVVGLIEDKALGTPRTEGPVDANAVVDPSAAETDPINPSFSPQNKAEFDVATRNLVKNLPDDQMPGIYDKLKDAVDDQLAVAADDEQRRRVEKSGTPMQSKSGINVEEAIRLAVRRFINEALPAEVPQVTPGDDGMEFQDMAKELGHGEKVHNVRREYERAIMKMKYLWSLDKEDREHLIGTAFDDYLDDLDDEKEELTPADFKWFVEKQRPLVDEYVQLLMSAGDMTTGDVMLLRDHPQIVVEQPGFKAWFLDNYEQEARYLPGFTEYLHDYVRSAMRGQKIELPQEGSKKPGVVVKEAPEEEPTMEPVAKPVELGRIFAYIAGDYRYADHLKLMYDPATDTATVTVSSTGAAGGMDTFNGATEPMVDYKRTSKKGVKAKDLMDLLKVPLTDRRFNFKTYGKPTKRFSWNTGAKGLSAKLAADALALAKEQSKPTPKRAKGPSEDPTYNEPAPFPEQDPSTGMLKPGTPPKKLG